MFTYKISKYLYGIAMYFCRMTLSSQVIYIQVNKEDLVNLCPEIGECLQRLTSKVIQQGRYFYYLPAIGEYLAFIELLKQYSVQYSHSGRPI